MLWGSDLVQIMGFGADGGGLPAGTVCPPGANYCSGPSQLSPADVARVQAENQALQTAADKTQKRHYGLAILSVLIVGAGVAYSVRKG